MAGHASLLDASLLDASLLDALLLDGPPSARSCAIDPAEK
jgi:hypothetical protein